MILLCIFNSKRLRSKISICMLHLVTNFNIFLISNYTRMYKKINCNRMKETENFLRLTSVDFNKFISQISNDI